MAVDIQKLNKRFVEVAKQEFGIDLNVDSASIIKSGFTNDAKILLSFRESAYKPIYKSMKGFKLNLGQQPLVPQYSILNVHQYFTVNQSGT
jgi:hypothetical protein